MAGVFCSSTAGTGGCSTTLGFGGGGGVVVVVAEGAARFRDGPAAVTGLGGFLCCFPWLLPTPPFLLERDEEDVDAAEGDEADEDSESRLLLVVLAVPGRNRKRGREVERMIEAVDVAVAVVKLDSFLFYLLLFEERRQTNWLNLRL